MHASLQERNLAPRRNRETRGVAGAIATRTAVGEESEILGQHLVCISYASQLAHARATHTIFNHNTFDK